MSDLVKTVQGLAIASVKTVQGLAIASVKTVQGLSNVSGSTLVVFDDFDSAGLGTALNDRTGWAGQDGGCLIVASGGGKGFTGSGAGYGVCLYSGASASLNQRVEITLTALSGFDYTGPAVRLNGTNGGYASLINPSSWDIEQIVGGTYTGITSGSHSWTAGTKVALEVIEDTPGVSCHLNLQVDTGSGWTNVTTNQSGTYVGSGKGGVATYGNFLDGVGDDFYWYDL